MKLFSNKKGIGRFIFLFFLSLFSLLLILIGIRGRITMLSPIRVGTAYFSNSNLLNQLGLNPNFVLIQSYFDSRKSINQRFVFMDDKAAIEIMQHELNVTAGSQHPFARNGSSLSSEFVQSYLPEGYNLQATKPNVILILMESMSANKMKRHGNSKNLTPFLDSLSTVGWYFDNFYSTGIHTYGGIFSSLYSLPTIFMQSPLKRNPMLKVHGMPQMMKQNGYKSIFFLAHDGQFDNIAGFAYGNGFDRVVEEADYPAKEMTHTFGVPDDFMFRYSIPIYNEFVAQNQPFFGTMLTISDHGPYYIPPYFHPKATAIKERSVEYADYSLRKFIELCRQQSWFNNTIFVFVADHGAAIDVTYNLSLSYYHIPFLIYYPLIHDSQSVKNNTFSKLGSQVDIAPTIVALLNIQHFNYGFGVNLLNESREFVVLMGDDRYGVLNEEYLFIIEKNGDKALYKYRENDKTDYAVDQPDLVKRMGLFAKAYFQSFDYLTRQAK